MAGIAILLTFMIFAVADADCGSDQVFSVPITNVTLSNGAVERGIPLSIGTPPQKLLFFPQWPLNDTWIFDQSPQCSSQLSKSACTTYRGGLYDESLSSTHASISTPSLNDSTIITSGQYVTDTIQLSPNVSIASFDFGNPRMDFAGQYAPLNALGLGVNSTLIEALLQKKLISSRSWSMWWGMAGATEAATQDGGFVFGGYDRAKTQGQGYSSPLSQPSAACPSGMILTVSDMVLDFPNGTQTSLVTKSQGGLTACLLPGWQMAINMDLDYFESFEGYTDTSNIGRSFGPNFYGMLYPPGQAYQGSLIIKLSSGLQSTVVNSQLVLPDQYIDNKSGDIVANSSANELLINSLQQINSQDLPKIGNPFLSGAYLHVNQDTSQFTLWPASPNATIDLVAVGATCPPPIAATSSPAPSSSADTLSTGAIVGIAIGGVAVLAIIAGVIAFLVLRRKRAAKAAALAAGQYQDLPGYTESMKQHQPSQGSYPQAHYGWGYQDQITTTAQTAPPELFEMPATQQDPHEMASQVKTPRQTSHTRR